MNWQESCLGIRQIVVIDVYTIDAYMRCLHMEIVL